MPQRPRKERGVEKAIVVKAIEQAFLVTARKKFGIQGEYETRYNEEDDDMEDEDEDEDEEDE